MTRLNRKTSIELRAQLRGLEVRVLADIATLVELPVDIDGF